MASMDSAYALEEEVGLRTLLQPPVPVSSLADPSGVVANISGR
jgi:hypothetical protein